MKNTDTIFIKSLSFFAHHGVFDAETALGQNFVLSVKASVDLSTAGHSDDWKDTVCYSKMTQLCVKIGTETRFHLLEALAETIAERLFQEFPPITELTLTLEKPNAAIPAFFGSVGIEITRFRK